MREFVLKTKVSDRREREREREKRERERERERKFDTRIKEAHAIWDFVTCVRSKLKGRSPKKKLSFLFNFLKRMSK